MAILPKAQVVVQFKGLNQKDPQTMGVAGGLDKAENVIIKRGDQNGIEFVRRNGIASVAQTNGGGSSSYGPPSRMVSYKGGIVVSNAQGPFEKLNLSTNAFSYSSSYAAHGVLGVARTDMQASEDAIALGASTPSRSGLDVAAVGDLLCFVWYDELGNIQYAIRDRLGVAIWEGTVTFVAPSVVLRTKIVSLGTSWFVFWKEANAIKASVISSTLYTAGAPVTVIAAGSALAGTNYDIQTGFDTTHIALLYRSAAGTYVRCLLSTALVVGTTVSDAVAADQPDVALCWMSQRTFGSSLFYATLNAANGLRMQTIDKATLAITSTATNGTATVVGVQNMTGGADPASATPFVLIDSSFTDSVGVSHRVVDYVDGFLNLFLTSAGSLASRVAYFGNYPSVAVLYNSSQASGSVVASQPTLMIVRAQISSFVLPAVVAKAMPGSAGLQTSFDLTSFAFDSVGTAHGAFAHAVQVETVGGKIIPQYVLSDVSLTTNPTKIGPPIAFGGVALFPGGELWEIDNSSPSTSGASHEQGFRMAPEIPVLTEGLAASGNIAPGTRSYIVRWKWVDSSGQVYRSATSTPVAITTVNVNSSVSVSTYAANSTAARVSIAVEILRTPINGNGDVYYSINQSVISATPHLRAAVANVDTVSEAVLLSGEPFDASSTSELDNIAPPALNFICEHKGRVFGIDAEQPWRIRFTKPYVVGTSVGFTDAFIIETPEGTGGAYSLASMDGHLLIIKKDVVYLYDGDFPDATGGGPAIQLPTLLPVGVGSDQPRSVIVSELGVGFYSSLKGFWLLDRSLAPHYIGAGVETDAASQTVSGATLHPTYPQIRWTTEGGTTFVLDTYFTKQRGEPVWMTFTGQPCVHSIVHDGSWYLLTAGGALLKEDLNSWQDSTGTYTAKIKVSDINFGGINGFVRVWRGLLLGEWYSSHRVQVTTSYNHRSVAGQVFTFDATTDPDPYVLRFNIGPQQKMTSMNITIEDTGDYQGRAFAWSALTFQVGVKPGTFRRGTPFNMVGG